MLRILSLFLLFLSFFILPWWFTFIFSMILIFVFDFFVEAIVLGFLFDIIYGSKSLTFMGISYFFTIFYIIFFSISFWLKKVIKFS